MKKVISILLTVILMFSLVSVAFAAGEKAPVIVVTGMGTDQYEVAEDGTRTMIWPPQTDTIVNAVTDFVPGLIKAMIKEDYSDIGSSVGGIRDLFISLACDENGKLIKNIEPDYYPLSINNYPDGFSEEDTMSERAICRSVGDEIGYENSFFFNYTWSRNPMDIAEDLNDYIASVLSQTGARKVSLVACSMGGTVTMSYIYKYGTSKLKNVIFASSAFQGTEIVGQLFNKDVNIDIYDALSYFSEFLGYDIFQTIVMLVQRSIKIQDPFLLDKANNLIAELVGNLKEVAFSDVFLDTFVAMPGIWALIPHTYYESAKTALDIDKTKYAFLENGANCIDNYMNNVQSKASELIAKARKNGVNVYVTATYMCPGIPVQKDSTNYTDNLIDVKYASGGATAARYGSTLTGTLNTTCDDSTHSHLSPDKIVDASTCILPEQTWIIKNVGHMNYEYNTGLCGLLTTLATSEKEVSIYTYEEYPQFMKFDKTTKTLVSDYDNNSTSRFANIFEIVSDLITKIKALINQLFPFFG